MFKYFSIVNIRIDTSLTILNGLDKVLPKSLEYLDLDLIFDLNNLRIFWKIVNTVRLDKLLIRNSNVKDNEITFDVLKEFVTKTMVKDFTYQVDSHYRNYRYGNLVNEIWS